MPDMFDVQGAGSLIGTTIFRGGDQNANNARVWEKPRNTAMVGIWCIGGGGSGGAGTNTSTLAGRAGGGGGGSGGISRLMVAGYFLPDLLYVCPGVGGKRATAGLSGSPGFISQVTLYAPQGNQLVTGQTLVYANGGNGGNLNTTAGSGASSASISTAVLANMGIVLFQNGMSGGNGGSTSATPGADRTALSSLILTGGGGGGGATAGTGGGHSANGGNIIAGGLLPGVVGGVGDGTPGGDRNGSAGTWLWSPMCGTGGSGGGSADTGTGGSGGDGAFGCGGGGGAPGAGSGGVSGAGGDGMIIITAWS